MSEKFGHLPNYALVIVLPNCRRLPPVIRMAGREAQSSPIIDAAQELHDITVIATIETRGTVAPMATTQKQPVLF